MKKGPLSLETAKKKYPDWYERRIIRGEPRGHWVVKRDLYDWWLRRIRTEIKVGHRFYGIMTLAIYAKKCGIDEDELRTDAYSLLDTYESKTESATNHFTEDDIICALEMYNEDYVTFPRADIEKISGIPVPPNKRNGRKQKAHIRYMNNIRSFKVEEGETTNGGRPKGSTDKKPRRSCCKIVQDYRNQHPGASPADCVIDTGLSQSTVYRWWKETAPDEG